MSRGFDQGPEWRRFRRGVLNDMLPKLRSSAVSISLVPDGEGDVKFWVELGASIMLDKPIIAIVQDGADVPERLLRVADELVVLEHGLEDEAAEEQVMAAIARVMGE